MHKYGDNWKGTHKGRKIGKTFSKPGSPNKKAQWKLRGRIKRWEKDLAEAERNNQKKAGSLRDNKPGSLNRSNH